MRSQGTQQPRPQVKERTLGTRLVRDKLSVSQVKACTLCKCVRFGLVAEPWSLGARGNSTTTTRHFPRGLPLDQNTCTCDRAATQTSKQLNSVRTSFTLQLPLTNPLH